MDFDAIKSFILMAEIENLTEAAEQLYLSPSSLTGRIKKIENELGVELFRLKGRTLALSPAGKVFLSYAKHYWSIGQELEGTIATIQDEEQRLRLAATPAIATYILPSILKAFKNIYSNLNLTIYSCSSNVVREHLLKDKIDLGIIRSSEKYETLDYEQWFSERDILVVSSSHPWAMKKEVEVSELITHPLLAYQRYNYLWKNRLEWIRMQGVNPWIGMELTHIETVKDILLQEYGYSFLPFEGIQKELKNKQLTEIELVGAPSWIRHTQFITSKKQEAPDICKQFIQFSKEHFKQNSSEGKLIS